MKTHILLDIEALGTRPGSAIIELGAVAFDPVTGDTIATFSREIRPDSPLTADLETLAWHRDQGTWPREDSGAIVSIRKALADFSLWVIELRPVDTFWSWGSTYDFPLLMAAFDVTGVVPPWKFYQCHCARTVWQLAFPFQKHDARPHRAMDDALAAKDDLMKAGLKLTRVESEVAV